MGMGVTDPEKVKSTMMAMLKQNKGEIKAFMKENGITDKESLDAFLDNMEAEEEKKPMLGGNKGLPPPHLRVYEAEASGQFFRETATAKPSLSVSDVIVGLFAVIGCVAVGSGIHNLYKNKVVY